MHTAEAFSLLIFSTFSPLYNFQSYSYESLFVMSFRTPAALTYTSGNSGPAFMDASCFKSGVIDLVAKENNEINNKFLTILLRKALIKPIWCKLTRENQWRRTNGGFQIDVCDGVLLNP